MPKQARFLWFFMLSYTVVLVMANWFDARLIHVFGLNTDAGTLIFPLTFLISDLLTEVYGYKNARLAIWTALGFNFLFMLYGQLVTHLPSPAYAANTNVAFDHLFKMNVMVIIASTLSYLLAEPANSYVMARMKIVQNGKMMGLRFIASTWIASAIDSSVFTLVAFYSVMSGEQLLNFILTMWVIKVVIEFIGVPVSTRLAVWLKKKEGIDIYDTHTRFNFFKFDTQYKAEDNHFK